MEQIHAVPLPLNEAQRLAECVETREAATGQEPETLATEGAEKILIDLPGVGLVPAGEASPERPLGESAAGEGPLPGHLAGGVEDHEGFSVEEWNRDHAFPVRAARFENGHAAALFRSEDEERNRLLGQLCFAAKDLAEQQIEPADGEEPAFCTECVKDAIGDGSMIAHEPLCRTGRVLRVLAELCGLAEAQRKNLPVADLPLRKGKPIFASAKFGEAWRVQDRPGMVALVDAAGKDFAYGTPEDKPKFQRAAACVNYCAAVPTRLVDDLTYGVRDDEQAVQQ